MSRDGVWGFYPFLDTSPTSRSKKPYDMPADGKTASWRRERGLPRPGPSSQLSPAGAVCALPGVEGRSVFHSARCYSNMWDRSVWYRKQFTRRGRVLSMSWFTVREIQLAVLWLGYSSSFSDLGKRVVPLRLQSFLCLWRSWKREERGLLTLIPR